MHKPLNGNSLRLATGDAPASRNCAGGAWRAAEKTLSADNSRQIATPDRFPAEFGHAKMPHSRPRRAKADENPQKTRKKRRKLPIFRDFKQSNLATKNTRSTKIYLLHHRPSISVGFVVPASPS
jgi:hypothetical protein